MMGMKILENDDCISHGNWMYCEIAIMMTENANQILNGIPVFQGSVIFPERWNMIKLKSNY